MARRFGIHHRILRNTTSFLEKLSFIRKVKKETFLNCPIQALLQNWLGYPAEPVLGKGFQPVDCVKM